MRKSFIYLSLERETIPSRINYIYMDIYNVWNSNPNLIYESLFISHPLIFLFFIFAQSSFHFVFCIFFHIYDIHIQHISLSRVNFVLYYLVCLVDKIDKKTKKKKQKETNQELEKQGLGCAIHMKQYTIMIHLTNQILWSTNEAFKFLIS